MEASALHAPALRRRPLPAPLLRLRTDEQLVALFRAGHEDAFAAIHDRYRQRLFAYVRQMLAKASRADAEDVLQDVFVRAYGALRADGRDVHLRAWLYRVAHNRCIDHLRRPVPPAGEVFDVSRAPLQDPIEAAQRRDDLKRLVADVGRLPDQQRSALLMREIDGLAYADIAAALDVTVPAVKSLLVRARIGLTEAAEARDLDCAVVRGDLVDAHDRGVKASGRARRHLRECAGCREFRGALKGMRRSFAALTPAGALGPLALAAKALGVGGAGGGAAAGGSAALGGGATLAGPGLATAAACKVAAVVCTAVVATGGAVEARHLAGTPPHARHARRAVAPAGRAPAASPARDVRTGAPVAHAAPLHRAAVGTAAAPGAGQATGRRTPEPAATDPEPAALGDAPGSGPTAASSEVPADPPTRATDAPPAATPAAGAGTLAPGDDASTPSPVTGTVVPSGTGEDPAGGPAGASPPVPAVDAAASTPPTMTGLPAAR